MHTMNHPSGSDTLIDFQCFLPEHSVSHDVVKAVGLFYDPNTTSRTTYLPSKQDGSPYIVCVHIDR